MRLALPILALFLFACDPEADVSLAVQEGRASAEEEVVRTDPRFDDAFRSAGEAYGIPPAVLKAYSYTQTRYEMVSGVQEFEGVPARSGMMALTEEEAKAAAELTGFTPEVILNEPTSNILAAAALLDAEARRLEVTRTSAGSWAPALAALAGLKADEARRRFIDDGVFTALRKGVGVFSEELEQAGDTLMLEGEFATPRAPRARAPDYADAVWIPSEKYNARPLRPSYVVIHTCEGGYAGCVGTLLDPLVIASAHYVVNEDGSEVAQLVREWDRAWHVGASYDCDLNGKVDCGLNGFGVNDFAVGIEHAGYASQQTFPRGQIEASARLLCNITRDLGIPRDRYHVVAHGKLQPYDRYDPGPNWPWTRYLELAREYCGERPPPPPCTVKGAIKSKYDRLGGTRTLGRCVKGEDPTADGRGRFNHFERGSIYWKPGLGAFAVQGGIRKKWEALDWERGRLGYPTTDERSTPDGRGRYNHFERGSIFWKSGLGAFAIHGAIRNKWAKLGWEKGKLGYPRTDEHPAAAGGRYNHFEHGSIYWRKGAKEAFAVQGGIWDKWAKLGWERGELGFPVSDERPTPDGKGRYSVFERGHIHWKPGLGAFATKGAIRRRWEKLGWEKGRLGYPTTDERKTADGRGRFNHFEKGSIFWKGGAKEAFSVQGGIRDKWAELGWERSVLGYPVADERPTPDGIGRYSVFEGGHIHWKPGVGAFFTRGAIRAKWAKLGWERGALGYPTTDERATANGTGRFNHFEKGSIYWKNGEPEAFAVRDAIRAKWGKLGWEKGQFGYPLMDERNTADGKGRYSHFEGGSIFLEPGGTEAFALRGAIRAKFAMSGWERGELGYPTSDEKPTADGQGMVQHFRNGAIYWQQGSAFAYVVRSGPLRDKWEQLGLESGTFGYPVTDERALADGAGRAIDFEHGSLVWHPETGAQALTGVVLSHWIKLGGETSCLGYPTGDPALLEGKLQASFQRGVITVDETQTASETCSEPGSSPTRLGQVFRPVQ